MKDEGHVVVFVKAHVNIARCARHSPRNDEMRIFDERHDARSKPEATRKLPARKPFERRERMFLTERMLQKKSNGFEKTHGKISQAMGKRYAPWLSLTVRPMSTLVFMTVAFLDDVCLTGRRRPPRSSMQNRVIHPENPRQNATCSHSCVLG